MDTAQNTVLYQNGDDRITTSQATIGGKTYDLTDINSVSLVRPVLRPEYGYVLAVAGLVLLIAGYLVWGVFLTPMLAGGILLIAGIAMALTTKKSYTVHLNHRNQQATTLQFPARAEAEQFVRALNQAGKR